MHVSTVWWCNSPSVGSASTPPDPCYMQRYTLSCLPSASQQVLHLPIVTACIAIDGIWYNVLLLEMSSVGLQNHLCAYDIPVYI